MALRWSVVITTRNRAEMLERAIASCVRQTVPCEIVVVDEASEDKTAEIIERAPAVKYVRNAHPMGHSAAANKGIREASGDWIKPLDDDDWLAQDCIEVMTAGVIRAKAKGFNPVIVSGRVINVDEKGREIDRPPYQTDRPACLESTSLLELMMLDQAPLGTPVQLGHHRQTALDVGGWNEHRTLQHQHGDEVELWIRLASTGDGVAIPNFVGYRTMWAGGSQERLLPEVRYESSVRIKDLISAQLGRSTSQSMRSYLALHWALVAARNRQFGQSARLGREWLRDPSSLSYMFRRRWFKDVRKLLQPI